MKRREFSTLAASATAASALSLPFATARMLRQVGAFQISPRRRFEALGVVVAVCGYSAPVTPVAGVLISLSAFDDRTFEFGHSGTQPHDLAIGTQVLIVLHALDPGGGLQLPELLAQIVDLHRCAILVGDLAVLGALRALAQRIALGFELSDSLEHGLTLRALRLPTRGAEQSIDPRDAAASAVPAREFGTNRRTTDPAVPCLQRLDDLVDLTVCHPHAGSLPQSGKKTENTSDSVQFGLATTLSGPPPGVNRLIFFGKMR